VESPPPTERTCSKPTCSTNDCTWNNGDAACNFGNDSNVFKSFVDNDDNVNGESFSAPGIGC
jgi:hypothetical protein